MPIGTTTPTCHPNLRASAALVMNSLARLGFAMRPWFTVKRVLVEVEAVDTPRAAARGGADLAGRGAVRPQRQQVQPGPALDVFDVGQALVRLVCLLGS